MTEAFDPYYQWLGIPPKDQPPNHYRLLGLELFEENRNVIATAADRQMGFIKNYQTGPVEAEELSQRILNELAAARLCLLNREKKAAYDQTLRDGMEPPLAEIVPSDDARLRRPSPVEPGKPPIPATSPTPARRVPVKAPVAAELVLPQAVGARPPGLPASSVRPRTPRHRADQTTIPLATIVADDADEPAVQWKIAPLAIGAGIGCLLLAGVLIASFAGLAKRGRQLERQTPVVAGAPYAPTRPATVPPQPPAYVQPSIPAAAEVQPQIPTAADVQPEPPAKPPAAVAAKPVVPTPPRAVQTPPVAQPAPEPGETTPPAHLFGEVGKWLGLPPVEPLNLDPPTIPADPRAIPADPPRPTPPPSQTPPEEPGATVSATVDLPTETAESVAQVALLIGEAQRLIDRRSFDDAKKKLLQVNLHEKDDARACFYLGLMAATVDRNPSDARKYFTRARQANEADVACLNNLALTAVRFRDASQAVRHWREALEIGPAPEVDHNVRLLLKLVDRDRLKLSSGLRAGIEEALHDGDRSGSGASSYGRAFTPGWRYMDYRGDGWTWPVLSDRTCLHCNGQKTTPCPASGCSRGRVRGMVYDTIPLPGRTIMKKERIVYAPCRTCQGKGLVSCPYCFSGVDRDL